MDATVLITAAAGLGTGVGYLLNALRHKRAETERAESTTLDQVARELRRLADTVEVRFARLPETVEAHSTDIRLIQRDVRDIRHDIGDVRREASELETRVTRVEGRLPKDRGASV